METVKKSAPVKKIRENRSYKLKKDSAPLSYMLPSRNSARKPLLHFDEGKGQNRPLRYSVNQKSPYEDDQDGNAILEPIIFEDGFLNVPKDNQVLQEFLHLHPQNGSIFVEVDKERDAQDTIEKMDLEDDAIIAAKNLDITSLERVARVVLGRDTTKTTSAELKRDVRIYAKKNPKEFLNALSDPQLEHQANVKMFFDKKILGLRNNRKEVFFNLPTNKSRMLVVPFGEDAYGAVSAFLKSDIGIDTLEMLEKQVETEAE